MTAVTAAVRNPFPGLRPFEAEESELFFGRETQTDELLRRLGRSRFVAVIGTSGSGKSSLVRAGLQPALVGGFLASAGSHWRTAILRPGADPIGALASALHAALYREPEGDHFVREMLEITLRRSSLGLVEAVRQARIEPHENLLVIVDQFEELFRFKQVAAASEAGDQAAAFVRMILEAARQTEVRVHVLITMRSDFLGDCASFRDLSEAINDGLYLIPRMTRDQLRLAITGPAAVHGADMTARLVQELLNDINDDPDQLPLLQHALMRTWNSWWNAPGPPNPIDLPIYLGTGGMGEGLSRHADEVWEELAADAAPARQALAKKLFQCLTEKGPDNREVRRPTRFAGLCRILEADPKTLRGIIERFREEDRAFLMPPRRISITDDTVVDISHESLIRKWTRLRGWVEEEADSAAMYRRIAEAARLHERGAAGLWGNPELQLGLEWRSKARPNSAWAERYDPGFELAMAFLDRSVEAREALVRREEEARRRDAQAARLEQTRKRIVALLVAAVVVMVVFAWLLVKNQRLLGETVARRLATQAALLASQSDAALAHSVLLAAESMSRLPSVLNDEMLRSGLALLPRQLSHLRHGAEVNQVAFSPDGVHVASASNDGTVRLMEANTGREVWRLETPGEKILAITFSRDGRVLAAGSQASTGGTDAGAARVVDAASGRELARLEYGGAVNAVAFSPDGTRVATASSDRTARIMDVASGRESVKLDCREKLKAVAFSPNGRHIAAGASDGRILVADAATGAGIWRFKNEAPVNSVAFSSDGRLLAVATGNEKTGLVRVLDARDGRPVSEAFHQQEVAAVAFSPDGRFVASASHDNTARLLLAENGSEVWRLLHQSAVLAIAFSPDGTHLATASGDKTARVIEVSTGRETARLPHEGVVDSVAFSPDGARVATGSADGEARVMESAPRKALFRLDGSSAIYAAALSSDQRSLATGEKTSGDKGAAIITGPAGNRIASFPHDGPVYALAYSPDGRFLATGSADNTVRLIDLQENREKWRAPGKSAVFTVAFSPDGRLVLAGGDDKQVLALEAATGRVVATVPQQGAVLSLAASPGGQRIAAGGSDHAVRVFDPVGKELLPPLAHQDAVNIVVYSPDGEYLATASAETIRVLRASTGKEVSRRTYGEWVYAVAFSPDGRSVAVGGMNGAVRVMEAATGREISAASYAPEKIFAVSFDAAGGGTLQVAAGNALYRELLRPQDLIREACSRLSRNLTPDEWRLYLPEIPYHKTCPSLP